MKKGIWFIALLLLGCSLSADQEAQLSASVKDYIDAHNEGKVVSFVAFTHPNVVDHYLQKGDSIFQSKFTLLRAEEGGGHLQDPTIQTIESKGNNIQVQYRVLSVYDQLFEMRSEEKDIYAISHDDGETWFFVKEKDYLNSKIFTEEDRLIETSP